MRLERVGPRVAEFRPTRVPLALHRALVHSIVAHPDGVHAISSGEDARLLMWDVERGAIAQEIAGARHLSIAPAADRAVWTEHRELVMIQLSTGARLAYGRLDENPASVLLRSDGARVFVGTEHGRARVYAIDS